jgi:hypothetical protein
VSLSRFWHRTKQLSWYFTPVHTKEKGVAPKFGSDKQKVGDPNCCANRLNLYAEKRNKCPASSVA